MRSRHGANPETAGKGEPSRRDASRREARLIARRRLRPSQPRARNQPFQGLPPDFPGARRLPKRRTEPLRPHAEARRNASRREVGSGRQRRRRLWQTRARNQSFQGLPPDFPGARRLPKRRTEPLRPHAEVRRNGWRGEAGSGRRPRRRLRRSRARNQSFQGLAPDFPGARRLPKRRTEPLRPHAEERRNGSGREAGSGRQRRRRLWQSRARNQPFQGLPPDFPGARRLPKRRTEPLRPHAEARCSASRPEAGPEGGGVRTCGGLLRPARGEVGSEWSRSNVSNFATRRSVGGGASAGGGAALRQADTGRRSCVAGSAEQKQNILSSTWQDIVGFFRRPLGEAPAIRAGGRRRRGASRMRSTLKDSGRPVDRVRTSRARSGRGGQSASSSASPVRMRMARSIDVTKILPSPVTPVRAVRSMT